MPVVDIVLSVPGKLDDGGCRVANHEGYDFAVVGIYDVGDKCVTEVCGRLMLDAHRMRFFVFLRQYKMLRFLYKLAGMRIVLLVCNSRYYNGLLNWDEEQWSLF